MYFQDLPCLCLLCAILIAKIGLNATYFKRLPFHINEERQINDNLNTAIFIS